MQPCSFIRVPTVLHYVVLQDDVVGRIYPTLFLIGRLENFPIWLWVYNYSTFFPLTSDKDLFLDLPGSSEPSPPLGLKLGLEQTLE